MCVEWHDDMPVDNPEAKRCSSGPALGTTVRVVLCLPLRSVEPLTPRLVEHWTVPQGEKLCPVTEWLLGQTTSTSEMSHQTTGCAALSQASQRKWSEGKQSSGANHFSPLALRVQMEDCGGPPAPGEDPMLGLSWLLEEATFKPLSRIVTLWRGGLLCPVHVRMDFAAMAAYQLNQTKLPAWRPRHTCPLVS